MAGGKRASAQHRGRIPKLICCYNKCRPHTIAAASAPKAGRRYGSHELLCRSEADRNDFARSCFAADLHSGSYHRQDRGSAPLPPKYQFPRCVPRGRKHDLPASSKQPARVQMCIRDRMQTNARAVGQICPASGRKRKPSPPKSRRATFAA